MAAAATATPTRANFMNASSNSPRRVPCHSVARGRGVVPGGRGGRLGAAVTATRDEGPKRSAACRRGAMPYHRHRRRGCKVAVCIHPLADLAPGRLFEPRVARLPGARHRGQARGRPPERQLGPGSRARAASLHEVVTTAWST